jgi:hypothetical protein
MQEINEQNMQAKKELADQIKQKEQQIQPPAQSPEQSPQKPKADVDLIAKVLANTMSGLTLTHEVTIANYRGALIELMRSVDQIEIAKHGL